MDPNYNRSSIKIYRMSQPCRSNFIYLDNNATTVLCKDGVEALAKYAKCYNPSSDSAVSKPAKKLLKEATQHFRLRAGPQYKIIFTSGATESNCTLLRSVADAFKRKGRVPHFIASKMEHISTILCLEQMTQCGAEVTWIEPTHQGSIDPSEIEQAIKPNTALIVCLKANNETGVVLPVEEIHQIAHNKGVPVFSDQVQWFGKYKPSSVEAFSASFHKLYGPKGVGLLCIDQNLIDQYELSGQINGHQQDNFRGGTENVAGVAAALAASKWNFNKRKEKNDKLLKMKQFILDQLEPFDLRLLNQSTMDRTHIVIFGSVDPKTSLPNTILLSIVVPLKPFCNVKFKHLLDKKGIVLSIGSACNTKEKNASHVVQSILDRTNFTDEHKHKIKQGILRISLGDYNLMKEMVQFMDHFVALLRPVFGATSKGKPKGQT